MTNQNVNKGVRELGGLSLDARRQAEAQAKAITDAQALRIAKERRFSLSASMLAGKQISVEVKNDPRAPLAYMDIRNNKLMLNEGDARLDMSEPVKALIYTRANLFHEVDHSLFTSDCGAKLRELANKATDKGTFDFLRNALEDGRIETLGKQKFAGQADFLNTQLLAIAKNLGPTPLDGLHIYVRTGLFRNKAEAKFWQPYKAEIDKAIHAPSTSKMLDIAFAISEAISQPQPQGNGNGGEGEPEQGGEGTTQGEPQGASEGEEQGEEQGASDVDAGEDEGEDGGADSDESSKDDNDESSDEDGDANDEDEGDGDGEGNEDGEDGDGASGDEDGGDEGNGDSDSDEDGDGDGDSLTDIDGDSDEGEDGEASDKGEGEDEGNASDGEDEGDEGNSSALSAGKGDSKPSDFDQESFDKLSKLFNEAMQRCEAEAEADYRAIVAEAEAYEPEQTYASEDESGASDELTSAFTSLLTECARTRYYGARAGLLNQASLANALTSRKCFHRREETLDAPHVALLLDVSGSMSNSASKLTQAARILNGALLKAKIATLTLTFGGDEGLYGDESCLNKFRTIPASAPLQVHGGTPTHLAMRAANDWLEGEGATRGLVIVITDGSPNDMAQAQNELQRAEQSGAYVIGVLIGLSADMFSSQASLNVIASQFHDHAFCLNVADLANVIAPLLAQYIAQS